MESEVWIVTAGKSYQTILGQPWESIVAVFANKGLAIKGMQEQADSWKVGKKQWNKKKEDLWIADEYFISTEHWYVQGLPSTKAPINKARMVKEQAEKEIYEKAEKMLGEAHRKIIDDKIETWKKEMKPLRPNSQSLLEFLGWTREEYTNYALKGLIPERTKMPYPDIDIVVTKRVDST